MRSASTLNRDSISKRKIVFADIINRAVHKAIRMEMTLNQSANDFPVRCAHRTHAEVDIRTQTQQVNQEIEHKSSPFRIVELESQIEVHTLHSATAKGFGLNCYLGLNKGQEVDSCPLVQSQIEIRF